MTSPETNERNRSVRFETNAATDEPMKLVVKKTFIEVDDHSRESLSPGRRRATAPATPAFRFDGEDWIQEEEEEEEDSSPPPTKRTLDVCNSEDTETVAGSRAPSNLSSNTSSWDTNLDRHCSVDTEIAHRRPSKSQPKKQQNNAKQGAMHTQWMQDDPDQAERDAHATELELHAAELKLAALRAEAAAQHARSQAPESRTRPNAQAQPFMPSGMPPAGMEVYPGMPMPGMFAPPFLTSTAPLWQYSSGDASTRNPGMPMPFDPSMFGQPYAQGYSSMNYNPKQRRAWENYHRQQANEAESKPKSTSTAKADQDFTTVMLRNMPCDYTRDMLVEVLDAKGFAGKFDFLYVPFDFKKQAGLGYAFMNLITHEDALHAMKDLQGFTDWAVPTQKVMQVSWSHPLQGLAANIERYRNSPVMHPDVPEKFKPLLFKHGKSARFPPPTKPLQQPEMRNLV